ncbi:hypothetical protein PCASD_14572 [Puccinia coronata f. sp. avenae]|uniref:Pyridoxamine kinase/Phosphomethylpyrimidine kinase domain-containing protein n=1 Tax=Puccinia coronata f. sp. avenae TaxID=200324 RepID=A0A2N5TBD3_9BASI|nr:hypothetical protein PCASD_14572 [Puccinia coronata f. sp. avenae]
MRSTNVLTIAGSDSSGGAGIQADLKTFTSLEAYGMSVITAVTAQNTTGVTSIVGMSPSMVSDQLESVISDIPVTAIKTGMLYSPEVIEAVANSLSNLYPDPTKQPPLVIDPVLVSSSGQELLQAGGPEMLIKKLLQKSCVVTPNLPEALILSGRKSRNQSIENVADMQHCCREIARLGATNVLLKGGHILTSNDTVTDMLYQAGTDTFTIFNHPRLEIPNTHGTGCTLSAALAVYLGKGFQTVDAVGAAIKYVEGGIQHSFQLGKGTGPLNHFHNIIQRPIPIPTERQNYPFTSALISAAGPSWHIFTSSHPFLQGVRDGKLPSSCFQHFLRQDYIFLTHYARIHSLMAFKCDQMDEIDATATIVKQIAEESKNHITMCKSWGLSEEDFLQTPECNQTIAYTRYVMDIGLSKSLLDLRVAVAPCLIGYGEMALALKKDPATIKDDTNPYWKWISHYADQPFQSAVVLGRQVLEEMVLRDPPSATSFQSLQDIFKKAVQLEIDFWQMGLDG